MTLYLNQIRTSKREAVSTTKKIASMLAKTNAKNAYIKELDIDGTLITPRKLLDEVMSTLIFYLKSEHREDCLTTLNEVIEKKYRGRANKILG